jgi:ketosteroid isomerase-like protein
MAAFIALIIAGLLYVLLYRTRIGKAIRAVANNRQAAELAGIPSTWVLALSFGLGAALACVSGPGPVHEAFGQVASWFSDCTGYDIELVAAGASGDLAYTVVFEHSTCSVNGVPRRYRLRATHVYRREDGQWRFVHRHADEPPGESDFSG